MANGIVVRPDAQHANVPALQDAYRKMQDTLPTDNRSWIYWASFHGFNRYECWHDARIGLDLTRFPYDLFLPWHRAYLIFFDNAARDQNPDAIVPWWDWTSDLSHAIGLPTAYTGGGSALQSGPVPALNGQPAGQTVRNPSSPSQLPTPERVEELLDITDFRDFSNQLQGVHGGVHGWVGGHMGVIATAAFDPIFWAHHAMIDRIWYLWQLRHGVNNIPAIYLDKALFPGLTVQQVLDVRALGYDYGVAYVAAGAEIPPVPDESEVPAPESEPEPPTTGPAYTAPPLDTRTIDPTAERADIEFHQVDHAGPSYEGRVYLNNPGADADTGYDDPSYAGSYYVFGHGGCLGDVGHCDVEPRRPYDPRPAHPLTKAKKVVTVNYQARQLIKDVDEVTVTVVPIVEPVPYEIESRYTDDPVDIGDVRIATYYERRYQPVGS